MRKYRITQQGSIYSLYESDKLLCSFTRETLREKLEALNRGSNWVGTILRFLNRDFPCSPSKFSKESPEGYGVGFCIEYLRSKGYKVYHPCIGGNIFLDFLFTGHHLAL